MIFTRLNAQPAVGGWALASIVFLAAAAPGCRHPEPVIAQLAEARTLAADLQILFNRSVAATDRAVLADTDDASGAAANEARKSRAAIEQSSRRLSDVLHSLGYSPEIQLLDEFTKRFKDYQTLDDTLLGLAVENTNIKAQRLSFGPGREAGDAFRTAMDAVVHNMPAALATRADAIAARAEAAVLEVQVLEARHNAEADEGAMAALEGQMKTAETAARAGLKSLKDLAASAPGSARPPLDSASAALDRFFATRDEIVQLSRRNTNVRSTALALGRKRALGVACEDTLGQLSDALSQHQFAGTR